MPEPELNNDYLNAIATKFLVLSEVFASFREPEAVAELVDIIANNDVDRFAGVLERFDANRIKVFPPATPCFIVADMVRRVFDLPEQRVDVAILFENLDIRQELQVARCQHRHGGQMRRAMVLLPNQLMRTERTVVEGADFVACLRASGLVEAAEEVINQQIEVFVPTGEKLRLCPPPGLR